MKSKEDVKNKIYSVIQNMDKFNTRDVINILGINNRFIEPQRIRNYIKATKLVDFDKSKKIWLKPRGVEDGRRKGLFRS